MRRFAKSVIICQIYSSKFVNAMSSGDNSAGKLCKLARTARMNLSTDEESLSVAFACDIWRNTSAGATEVRCSLDIVSRPTPLVVVMSDLRPPCAAATSKFT